MRGNERTNVGLLKKKKALASQQSQGIREEKGNFMEESWTEWEEFLEAQEDPTENQGTLGEDHVLVTTTTM